MVSYLYKYILISLHNGITLLCNYDFCCFTQFSRRFWTNTERSRPSSLSLKSAAAFRCVSLLSRSENCFQAGSLRLPGGRPKERRGNGSLGRIVRPCRAVVLMRGCLLVTVVSGSGFGGAVSGLGTSRAS